MSKKDNKELIVSVKEWHDNIIKNAIEAQDKIFVILCRFLDAGFPIPKDVRKLTPEYIDEQVENGRKSYNSKGAFLPLSIRKANDREFDKIAEELKPDAEELQHILKQTPYTIERVGDEWQFDIKEISEDADNKSLFPVSGESYEYLCILQEIAKKIEDARKWESKHGWVEFVGIDKVIPLPSGGVYYVGWAEPLKDAETNRFELTPERFVNMIIRGAIGKKGIFNE